MSTTVQNIIDAAIARSNLNNSSLISATQLYFYISQLEKAAFLYAARENPDFFGHEGNTTSRSAATDTWNLASAPGNVAAVSRIEINAVTGSPTGLAVGDEINLVSIRHLEYALAPRVYLRNKTLYEYNSELQSSATDYVTRLKIYYSFLPDTRTAAATNLDLPDEFSNIIVLPLARILALSDQRADEANAIDAEYQLALNTFQLAVKVFDEATIRGADDTAAAGVLPLMPSVPQTSQGGQGG